MVCIQENPLKEVVISGARVKKVVETLHHEQQSIFPYHLHISAGGTCPHFSVQDGKVCTPVRRIFL
jgi:hypothetical protein